MIIGARQGGLNINQETEISQKLLIWDFQAQLSRVCREWCEKQKTSSEQQFCGQKCSVNERGQRRRTQNVKDGPHQFHA